jgi:hypothetical protein
MFPVFPDQQEQIDGGNKKSCKREQIGDKQAWPTIKQMIDPSDRGRRHERNPGSAINRIPSFIRGELFSMDDPFINPNS